MQNFKTKSIRTNTFFILFLSFAFLLSSNYSQVYSQTNVVTVSPQLIQLDLSKDQPEAEYSYTNSTNQTIELALTMQDVKELEDRGIPGLLDGDQARNYKYGLSSWARFSNNSIVIAPNETKKVIVYIDKTRLTLGGHYASVLAEIKQKEEGKTVKLKAILSSLLFVRSGSEFENEQANITSLQFTQKLFSFPSNATFRLQNTGNVDLTPYGILTITDPFNRTVARTTINEDSLITLPDSTRKYMVAVNARTGILAPGIYKARLSINYGKKKAKKEISASFISIGSIHLIGLLGVGALTLGATVTLLKLRTRKNTIK